MPVFRHLRQHGPTYIFNILYQGLDIVIPQRTPYNTTIPPNVITLVAAYDSN